SVACALSFSPVVRFKPQWVHSTASLASGAKQPGQVLPVRSWKPASLNRSSSEPSAIETVGLAGAATGADLATTAFFAAPVAGFAAPAAFAGAAAWPGVAAAGTRKTLWQPGHLTALPANSSRTLRTLPQEHFNRIGMDAMNPEGTANGPCSSS